MRFTLVFLFSLATAAAQAAPQKPAMHEPARPPVDVLFAQLAKTQSPEDARPIEERIFALFDQSGSPSIDLLMARAAAAMAGSDNDAARKLFDSVTGIAPDFAEGWHERAQLQVADGDDEAAMISLQKAVILNPRQFEAMSQLGDLLEEYGDKAGALKMYKRALALDPQLEGAAKHVQALERAVEGQGI
jgi:tetratricopeptide (TPR) repeat protein